MDRRVLDIKRMIEEMGYQFISYEHKRGGHAKVTISDGNVSRFSIFPVSASDTRWKRNKPAELKRIFREYFEGKTHTQDGDTRDDIKHCPNVGQQDGHMQRNRKSPRRNT